MRRFILTALCVALFPIAAQAQVSIVPSPYRTPAGTGASPGLRVGDDDTGLYLVNDNSLGFTSGATWGMFLTPSSLTFSSVSLRWNADGGGTIGTASANRPSQVHIGGGTLTTTATPFLSVSGTWNDAGTTHTGVKVNITDTNSTAASLLMDLQVGDVSKFKVAKDGGMTISHSLNVGSASGIGFTGRGYVTAPSDGAMVLWNNAGTGFTRLSFGGTTNSFPALEASGATLLVKRADGSEDAALGARQIITSGEANGEGYFSVTCTGTSPARVCSLQVYDGGALRTIGSMTY